jgi:hypothetical protein
LQTKLRGGAVDICVQGGGLQLDPVAAAAGDRMSPLGICPRPHQRLWDIEKMAENRPENSKSEANTREIRFSKSFFSSLLARLRGFAHFQGIRTWKINDLGEKVFTTGAAVVPHSRASGYRAFAAIVSRAGATKLACADQYIKTQPGEGTRSSLQPILATFMKDYLNKSDS